MTFPWSDNLVQHGWFSRPGDLTSNILLALGAINDAGRALSSCNREISGSKRISEYGDVVRRISIVVIGHIMFTQHCN
jgi:hypothetical protein